MWVAVPCGTRGWPPPWHPLLPGAASSCADTQLRRGPVRPPEPMAAGLAAVGFWFGRARWVGSAWEWRRGGRGHFRSHLCGKRSSKDTGAHPARALVFVVW